jgi:pyrrolidone-carboxylate peptidase
MNINQWDRKQDLNKIFNVMEEREEAMRRGEAYLLTNISPETAYIAEMAVIEYTKETGNPLGVSTAKGTFGCSCAIYARTNDDKSHFWRIFDRIEKEMAV